MLFLRVRELRQHLVEDGWSRRFYCDASLDLDEHQRLRSCRPEALQSVPKAKKSSQANSEKPTKSKLHRCRQCPFVSNVKVNVAFQAGLISPPLVWLGRLLGSSSHSYSNRQNSRMSQLPVRHWIQTSPGIPSTQPSRFQAIQMLEVNLTCIDHSSGLSLARCDYACVNLSMLRSHKKSHFRHLLFKCSNCSFESKQYHALQEHLQIEGHEIQLDENVEEFLREYSYASNSALPISTSTSSLTLQPRKSKKRKATSMIASSMYRPRRSSASSMDSSTTVISPVSVDEQPTALICSTCGHQAVSKEALGVHLFEHAYLFSTATAINPMAKLFEAFQGKDGQVRQSKAEVILRKRERERERNDLHSGHLFLVPWFSRLLPTDAISVVIPTFGRLFSARRCLSVANIGRARWSEVFFGDGGRRRRRGSAFQRSADPSGRMATSTVIRMFSLSDDLQGLCHVLYA